MLENNKKEMSEINSFKNEIKKLNKDNQELKNSILIKDITLDKYSEKLKDLEEKLKIMNDKETIRLELKEKEEKE